MSKLFVILGFRFRVLSTFHGLFITWRLAKWVRLESFIHPPNKQYLWHLQKHHIKQKLFMSQLACSQVTLPFGKCSTDCVPSNANSLFYTDNYCCTGSVVFIALPFVNYSKHQVVDHFHMGMDWVWVCVVSQRGLSVSCMTILFFCKLSNHQIRHQATHRVRCQLGDCYGHFNP